jgi:NADPH:quinone reductase-like Zn-dependent oxidoreductase
MVTKVVATAFGGPEVLAVVDEEVGTPGPGEVLLEIRAAGTNPVDYKVYSAARGGDPASLPMPLGFESSGVVLAVGDAQGGQDGPAGPAGPAGLIHVGDEVIAYRAVGSYASQIIVPAAAIVPKPSTLSFEEAAGLMLVGTTATHALAAVGVKSGETLVLHGASGGVGLLVIQLAVAEGVRVIGTASERTHAELRRLGAEPVLYGDGLVDRIRELAPDGVDAAIDSVGTDEAIDVSLELVSDRNRIATLANAQRGLALGIRVLGGAPGADPGTAIRDAARLDLAQRAGKGLLHVDVAATYPLTEAAEAHRQLATGHTHGKIILIP